MVLHSSFSFSLRKGLAILLRFYFYPQTILGEFQKEQQRFVQEKKAKQSGKS